MPIYEFRCKSCGHVFEELIFRQSEMDELICPKCETTQISRQMSACHSSSAQDASGVVQSGASCGTGSFT